MWCSDVGKDGKYMKIWNIWKTDHGILVEKCHMQVLGTSSPEPPWCVGTVNFDWKIFTWKPSFYQVYQAWPANVWFCQGCKFSFPSSMSGKGAVDPSGVTPNSGPCYGHNGDVQNKPAADVVPRDLSQAHLDDSWPMPCVFLDLVFCWRRNDMKQLAIAEDNCELLWIGAYCARGPLLMVFVWVKITWHLF